MWRSVWIIPKKGKDRTTFYLRWYDDTGKMRAKAVGSQKRIAEDRRVKHEMDLNAGNLSEVRTIRLADFTREHLDLSDGQVQPKTVKEYRIVLEQFLAFIGDRTMDSITTAHVEKFIHDRRAEKFVNNKRIGGVAEATANKNIITLHAIFARAVVRGYLKSNPCAGVRKLREPEHVKRILTTDEVRKLLNSCRVARWRCFLFVAVTTGARLGELQHLRWEDVDLDAGTLLIRCRPDHRTKSARNRTVALVPEAVAALRSLKAPDATADTWVFQTSRGTRMLHGINRDFRLITDRAGIAPCTIHDLRRTFLSHLQMAGVSAAVAQKIAGHASIQTTIRSYTEILSESVREAPGRLPYSGFSIVTQSSPAPVRAVPAAAAAS